LTFDNINLEFYEQFKDYILNEKKLLNNTFGKQIRTLKSFLNLATEKGINTNAGYKSRLFKSPQENIDHIYLTSDELDAIYKKDLKGKMYLDRVRDLFLIGCHTGLRFSDFTLLKKENLEETKTGFVLNVKTNKTGERVIIPLKPVVKAIWDKYEGSLPRAISNQKMNEYLKELGEEAEISKKVIIKKTSGKVIRETTCPKFKLISTHTARRSFATNAFLSGIPPISIMKFTGHQTESSFMKYIKISQEKNAELLSSHPFFS
jgi:integrase